MPLWSRKSPAVMPLGFAVVDVETTGFSPLKDRIIEMAIVHTDPVGVTTGEWVARFDPGRPVGATFIHGITDEDVRGQPAIGDLIPEVITRLRGRALVAHNARFDLGFMEAEFARYGWQMPAVPVLCTLEASAHYLPELRRRKLGDCCAAIGLDFQSTHAALSDAHATAALLARFLDPRIPPSPGPRDLALPVDAAAVPWPTAPQGPPVPYEPPPAKSDAPGAKAVRHHQRHLSPSLIALLADYPLDQVLGPDAPDGVLAYLELLLQVLEDGVVTVGEGRDLAGVADAYGLSADKIAAIHRRFLVAMGHVAVADGTVAKEERAEMIAICALLGEPEDLIPGVLADARALAALKSSQGLAPLPDDWAHGEPLRVGDGVAFTGCDGAQRARLEKAARDAGVRVTGTVSRKTALLVSDGSMDGTKAANARDYGTRVVHPDDFEVLLSHVQPALETDAPTEVRLRATPAPTIADPNEVRAWARAHGYKIGARGRIRAGIIEAYLEATQPSQGSLQVGGVHDDH